MPYPLDLHMHSQYSDDGEFSPAQLAEQCQAAGITLMAVTDHNSTRAVDETQEAAQTLGIQCISGVELDCRFQGVDLHLLGYRLQRFPSQHCGCCSFSQPTALLQLLLNF